LEEEKYKYSAKAVECEVFLKMARIFKAFRGWDLKQNFEENSIIKEVICNEILVSQLLGVPFKSPFENSPSLSLENKSKNSTIHISRDRNPVLGNDTTAQRKNIKKRVTKYEKELQQLGIHMDVEDIISRDLRDLKEELEVMVSTGRISQRQYEKIMVIRKKGKNKKAAQGCRAKKQEEIASLKNRVEESSNMTVQIIRRKEFLREEKDDWLKKLDNLKNMVLRYQDKDPKHWQVVVKGKKILFIQRSSTHS